MEHFFKEHMKSRNIDVFKYVVEDLKNAINVNNLNFEKIIEDISITWNDPDNEIRNRIKLFAVRSPDILKSILES